jgi:glutathione synthase
MPDVTLAVGVLMDPIGKLKIAKDSTFAMLLEAQRRGHALWYCTQGDLALREGAAWGRMAALAVRDDPGGWYELAEPAWRPLAELDVFLARKDPPVDAGFVHDTLVLDLAERAGVLVVNRPNSLRDANEKLYALHFPQCGPPTRVARDMGQLREFVRAVGPAVLKPLDGMAGQSIFKTYPDDPNLNVILETLTREGRDFAMAQQFIPEAALGDKRILVIDGEPVPFALARIPQGTDFRGNMARGGKPVAQPLSERDRWICDQVAPELRRRGLWFVGLDVIGDYLTEINVTSPTGIRELQAQVGVDIAGLLFDALEKQLGRPRGSVGST